MKSSISILFLVFTAYAFGQDLRVADTLDFDVVYEDAALTKDLEIINDGTFSIQIEDIDLFTVYGDYPFTISDTSGTLFPGDTFTVQLNFLPDHNIYHDMALVIKTNSGFGHKSVKLTAQGRYSKTYYNSTENLKEEQLKSALSTKLAQGYTQLSYSVARDNMYATIDNSNGDVECVYTGRTATFNTRAGANSNSFNTEHTFPQGFFNQSLPMRSDIHHLYPTDVTSNSQRGNDPFGVVSGSASWQNGGSKSGGGVFEPRDIHKGTCARAMMYFVLRYQDYSNHFSGQETILRQWHNQYPPSSADSSRNEAIDLVQNNRNPFIDYPQFEERISEFVTTSVAPSVYELYYSDDTINVLGNASGRYDYNFVFYNDGNEDINLNNFSLSDTSLYFDSNMPASIRVEAGGIYNMKISYNSSNSYNADLSFDTDINGLNQVVVPVRSGAKIGLEESYNSQVSIYPNPSEDQLNIALKSNEIKEIKIFSITGENFAFPASNQLDVSNLSSGMYFIRIQTQDDRIYTEKFLKK